MPLRRRSGAGYKESVEPKTAVAACFPRLRPPKATGKRERGEALSLQFTDKARFTMLKWALNINRREVDEATSLLIF